MEICIKIPDNLHFFIGGNNWDNNYTAELFDINFITTSWIFFPHSLFFRSFVNKFYYFEFQKCEIWQEYYRYKFKP